jgi:hypothetical protein
MAKVFGTIQVGRKRLRTLFDSEVTSCLISAQSAKGLPRRTLKFPRPGTFRGKPRLATEICLLAGKLDGNDLDLMAYVLDEVGVDDHGRPLDLLVGVLGMREWNIVLVPDEGRLDLSHFTKEFIEFAETRVAARRIDRQVQAGGLLG